MANEVTFKRGRQPYRPKKKAVKPKPSAKVIPVTTEYREGYDRIKWGK